MFLLLFTAFVMYLVYAWIKGKPPNFPPGPPRLPLVGSAPFIPKENGHFEMEKMRERYGPVIGLDFGFRLGVAVVSPQLVREVLKRDEFQGRPIFERLKDRTFGKRLGIMFADGPFWQEQRRFTVRHLKEFGFGKTSMESFIVDEVEELIKEVRDQKMQVSGLFNVSSVNVLWAITAGTRYERTDPQLQELMDTLTKFFRSGNAIRANFRVVIGELFPRIKTVLPDDEQAIVIRYLHKFFRKAIKEHEETLDKNNPRDFLDVYITEMQQQKTQTDTSYNIESLISNCFDLFAAGSESVGNTVGFALMYMVLYPEVQKKVHEAIDTQLGRSRKPSLKDRNSMAYIEAVISEVMRCNTIAPFTIPHRTTKDTTLNDYYIPKNTTVLISLWSICQDRKHWGDPENFRPERFLDDAGKLKRDDLFIPFGAGKRVCPGEALARDIMFVFFTGLLQEFEIVLPTGAPKPSSVCLSGFTTAPRPFEVIFKSR